MFHNIPLRILDDKAEPARETFRLTGVDDVVTFAHGDALDHLPGYGNIAFCFLDAERNNLIFLFL